MPGVRAASASKSGKIDGAGCPRKMTSTVPGSSRVSRERISELFRQRSTPNQPMRQGRGERAGPVP